MRFAVATILLMTFACTELVSAQNQAKKNSYPPVIEGAQVEVYKTIGDVKLNIYIFNPKDHKASDKRPAAIFFFGGGWRGGTPNQFTEHCKHLAARGMVAMTADYRVSSRHNTKAVSCVADAKSAIRWARQACERLGIDPDRIAAGGGSAGGHLAGCTGTISGFDEAGENLNVSSKPNAMVLFNPALVLAGVESIKSPDPKRQKELAERMGVDPKEISPYHHVSKGVPPTIIFHGQGDTTVPFMTAEMFSKAMKNAGNKCTLVGYEDQAHGFFNYGRSNNKFYNATVKRMDEFFANLGYTNE